MQLLQPRGERRFIELGPARHVTDPFREFGDLVALDGSVHRRHQEHDLDRGRELGEAVLVFGGAQRLLRSGAGFGGFSCGHAGHEFLDSRVEVPGRLLSLSGARLM